MTDILQYLQSKGIQIKRGTGPNVHFACPYCAEDPTKRGRLYMNIDDNAQIPGLWMCHRCGEKGSLTRIKKHFGDPIEKIDKDSGQIGLILRDATAHYASILQQRPDILDWLRTERGLTDETIEKHQIGWADGTLFPELKSKKYDPERMKDSGLIALRGGQASDFFQSEITIPYHVNGSVVQLRGKSMSGKYRTPPGNKARMFNQDSLQTSETALITEGEFDALVAEQMGYAAVGLPGAQQWKPEWASMYFDDKKRAYIVFDNDESGRLGADKIAADLKHKARVVEVPGIVPGDRDDGNDLGDWIVKQGHTEEEFAELLQSANGGYLVTVHDAYREFLELQNQEGIKFGYEELDGIMRPGLLPTQLMIILAKTNAGKTIILLNMFHRMVKVNPEINILFVSLEQTRGDWFERARRINAFYNLDKAPASLEDKDIAEFNERNNAHTLSYWEKRLLIMDRNRLSEEELVGCIEEYGDMMGKRPDLIAVDYLGYWAAGFPGSKRTEQVGDAMFGLKRIAKDYRVPVISPHQVNRGAEFGAKFQIDMARDSGDVENTADFVTGLWSTDHQKEKEPGDRTGDLKLWLGKSRHGGKGYTCDLKFGYTSLAIVGREDKQQQRLLTNEVSYATEKLSWEEAIFRHHMNKGTQIP